MKKDILIIITLLAVLTIIVSVAVLFKKPAEIPESDVIVTNPKPNETVESPITITGEAKGTWFFEASFPIRLIDQNGIELAVAIAQAQSDWMTTDYVPFKAEINFISKAAGDATLVFEKDNPSGLPENAKEFRIPVKIPAMATMKVKVYFNNEKMDPEFSCNKVFPVEREIQKTEGVARAALEELLKEISNSETAEGFFTSINSGVKTQKLTIENGTAKADFNDLLEFQVGGSCRVSAIRAQITETLKQFPTIKNVVISINGRTEDILQP